jgi:hypothetical protein
MISKTFASAWTMRRRSSGSPQASIDIFYAAVAAGDCALRRVSAQTPQRVEPVAILCAVLLRFRPCPPHLATRTACRSVRPAKSIAFPKLRATPSTPRNAPARKLTRSGAATLKPDACWPLLRLWGYSGSLRSGQVAWSRRAVARPRSLGALPGRMERRVFPLDTPRLALREARQDVLPRRCAAHFTALAVSASGARSSL